MKANSFMKNISANSEIRCLFLSILLFFFTFVNAQTTKRVEIKFGDVKPEDFAPTAYAVDSSADAVYLFDGGKTDFQAEDVGGVSFDILFTKHSLIRLLKKTSFEKLATINIELETDLNYDYFQKITDFKAAIYNIENGKITVDKATDKNLIKSESYEKKGLIYTSYKYTFPDVKEGSIIEYSYTVELPGFDYLPSWDFQGDYPCLWSEYEATIPTFYNYIINNHGYKKFDLNQAKETYTSYTAKDINTDMRSGGRIAYASVSTMNYLWGMKNIEGIKEESFITSVKNYQARIDFQFYSWKYPEQPLQYYVESWPEYVTKHFTDDKEFGKELYGNNDWLNDYLTSLSGNALNVTDQAKEIYRDVRDNYSVTAKDKDPIYLTQSLPTTFKTKQGNVADLNLLLTAMLVNRGMDAKPVLLSTRDNGRAFEKYPNRDQYNYLITKLRINDHDYFLDATYKDIAFGYLPEKCYNDSGRVIDDMPYLVPLSADSLDEPTLTSVFIFNGDKGMEGNFTSTFGNFRSAALREKMREEKQDEYFSNIKKEYLFDVDISNTSIDALREPDKPIVVKYDFDFSNDNADIIYFNPMLAEAEKNPFISADRFYPVEMPYCSDAIYTLNMEIPKGYTVDELPKSARVNLLNNDASFEYIIAKTDTNVQLRCRLKFNKANFDAEDYQSLRDFFAYVVKKENEQITFKKSK
jgi:hypothetical protein